MTPEEQDVIQAAIGWFYTIDSERILSENLEELANRINTLIESCEEWVPATLLQCLAGDRIRIGQEETDVVSSTSGSWHVDARDPYRPRLWEHVKLFLDLTANPGRKEYPPNTPCEILMSAERMAAHLMMQEFPGAVVLADSALDSSSVGK